MPTSRVRAGTTFWCGLALACLVYSATFSTLAPGGRWDNRTFGSVLWGEDDPCSPPYYTDGYHRVFTNSTFHFIAACGHFPHEERPEETVSAIRDFLAERRD